MKQDDNAISAVSVLYIFFALIKKSWRRTIQRTINKRSLCKKVKFTLHFGLSLIPLIKISARLTYKQNRKHFEKFLVCRFYFLILKL